MTSSPRVINRARNLKEFRAGRTWLESRPQCLIVELTQGCNLACEMCRPERISIRQRMMSNNLFERIAAELFPTAWLIDLRGWGESLVIPKIGERIKRAAASGAYIRFVTNFAFYRPDVLDLLVEAGCHIAVSVDAASDPMFRLLRSGADLELVASNLRMLVDAHRRCFGHADRIHLTTTMQLPALVELPSIIDFAADLGVPEVRVFSVSAPSRSPVALDGHEPLVDKMLSHAARRAQQRRIRLVAGTRLGSMPENEHGGSPCMHPWSYTYIAWNGSVGFCDHLIGPEGRPYIVGSLLNQSFENIWNGTQLLALRAEHLYARSATAPLFKECGWCYKHRFIDFEHLFEPRTLARRVFLANDSESKL